MSTTCWFYMTPLSGSSPQHYASVSYPVSCCAGSASPNRQIQLDNRRAGRTSRRGLAKSLPNLQPYSSYPLWSMGSRLMRIAPWCGREGFIFFSSFLSILSSCLGSSKPLGKENISMASVGFLPSAVGGFPVKHGTKRERIANLQIAYGNKICCLEKWNLMAD